MGLNRKSQQEMIDELESMGIRVEPVMKAMVPHNMGFINRSEICHEEMSVSDAYDKYVNHPLRNIDPFANKPCHCKSDA